MASEMQIAREVLGLGKDALTVAVVMVGAYSSLFSRHRAEPVPGRDILGGPKLGFEIPGIGSLFWKRM